MAIIGSIRKHVWIIIVLLGLAMAAFIIMSMKNSKTSNLTKQFELAEVNGQKVDYREFQKAESVLGNNGQDPYTTRDYVWNFLVEKALLDKEGKETGLKVTKEELKELEFGQNLSPVIVRNLGDRKTGQVDRKILDQYKQAIESGQLAGKYRNFWAFQEKQIMKERVESKLNALVAKGMYMPSWRVKRRYSQNNDKVEALYVKIPYDKIADDQVVITEDDIKNYIQEHPGQFNKKEETRSVIAFIKEAIPTREDTMDIYKRVADLKDDFAKAEDDSLFVETNYGIYDVAYATKDELADALKDTIDNMPVGAVYGPYMDGREYRLAKLTDKKILPDSVRASAISIAVQDQAGYDKTMKLLDSLKKVLVSGMGSMDSLALKYSQDPQTKTKGGDMGFKGRNMLAPSINNLLFFQAKKGEYYIVPTQNAVHLITLTDTKNINNKMGYRIAYVKEDIIPSEATQNAINDEMTEVMTKYRKYDELKKYMDTREDIKSEVFNGIKKNDYQLGVLGGGSTSRDIVRWAFEPGTELGDVSPEVYIYQSPLRYNEKFVIGALTGIYPAGLASIEEVRDQVMDILKKKKKAELLTKQLGTANLDEVAAKFSVPLDTAKGVSFITGIFGAAGKEPKVVGAVFGLQGGQKKVVEGDGGLFIVKKLDEANIPAPENLDQWRKINTSQYANRVSNYLMESLKKNAKVEDNRSKYY